MREWLSIIQQIILIFGAIGLLITAVVSAIKGDAAHVWVAYSAGSVAWLEMAEWVRDRS